LILQLRFGKQESLTELSKRKVLANARGKLLLPGNRCQATARTTGQTHKRIVDRGAGASLLFEGDVSQIYIRFDTGVCVQQSVTPVRAAERDTGV